MRVGVNSGPCVGGVVGERQVVEQRESEIKGRGRMRTHLLAAAGLKHANLQRYVARAGGGDARFQQQFIQEFFAY
eukprot:gene41583-5549_t